MYCNKVKKAKHCITYTLQLNLTKLNLDRSSSVRRTFQSSVVKTIPCSGCFTACMGAHFPVVKLGYVDRMTHCGMVPNEVANSPFGHANAHMRAMAPIVIFWLTP